MAGGVDASGNRAVFDQMVRDAQGADSAGAATITRDEAVAILASAAQMHISPTDARAALAAAGFVGAEGLSSAVSRQQRIDSTNLHALGFANVQAFQASRNIEPATGVMDTNTRAALEFEVQTMQAMLEGCGHSVGAHGADGRFGPDTSRAIVAFQRAHHLPPTGRLDAATSSAIWDQYQTTAQQQSDNLAWAHTRRDEQSARLTSMTANTPLAGSSPAALAALPRDQQDSLEAEGVVPRGTFRLARAIASLDRGIASAEHDDASGHRSLAATRAAIQQVDELGASLTSALGSLPSGS